MPSKNNKVKPKTKNNPINKAKAPKRKTTSKDMPGSGLAKGAAKAFEKRHKMLKGI